MPSYSYLDLVQQCDSFPSAATHPSLHAEKLSTLSLFIHNTHVIGYLLPSVATALRDRTLSGDWWTICGNTFSIHGDTPEARSANIAKTVSLWRQAKVFAVLGGWRNELYNVYAPRGRVVFSIERSATPLFGLVTYGSHLTAFVRSPDFSGGMAIWTPSRSKTKSTYPGMLDNTVAGGISVGYTPFETLVKEAEEEASLPEELVRQKAKCVGSVSYFMIRTKQAGGETGLLQPEIQICYDLDLTGVEGVTPKPCDDEVEEFELLGLDEVKAALKAGRFKPNCALVLLDFFIRHNILTPENEPRYLEIVSRIHRSFEFPTM